MSGGRPAEAERPATERKASLVCVTIVVREYDEAIEFFTRAMGFTLVEDAVMPGGKRWVVVAPGTCGARVLLARAANARQEQAVGNQTGGRVGFFLHTEDFRLAHERMTREGVVFIEPPREEPYGTVAVFLDLYGNRWDLVEPCREA